jgi:hypothetical protein
MPCYRTNLGPDTAVFTCSRSKHAAKDLPACSNCHTPNAQLACEFDLTGSKAGQRCNKPLCRICAKRSVPGRNLCPPHHKLLTSKR